MKQAKIILIILCVGSLHILAQQPQTIVFKVRKEYKTENVRDVRSVDEPAFIVVEENATFNGGDLGEFRNWVQRKLVYPQEAAKLRREGRVFIQFAVNSKGEVCDVKSCVQQEICY